MRKIVNKFLCYSIAMILLLFGMNFDEAEALFYTPNVQAESQIQNAYICEATISKTQSFDTQIVGTRTESPVQQIVRQSSVSKKDVRNLFCIVRTDIFSVVSSNFDMLPAEMLSPDISYRVLS